MIRRKMFGALVLIGMLFVGAVGGIGAQPVEEEELQMSITGIASGEATSAQAVPFSELIKFLPDAPSGWESEEPNGMTFTHEGGTWSMATESYLKSGTEDVTADVVITDYAFYTVGWTGAWQSFFAYESTEGSAKTVTVKGLPAWEIYSKDTNDYALHVGVNDRFLVVIATNSDKDTLYDFANSINYNGIAALGGGAAAPTETAQPTVRPTQTPPAEEGGETPGFEAIFAVAGLLVVMSLLKRRG